MSVPRKKNLRSADKHPTVQLREIRESVLLFFDALRFLSVLWREAHDPHGEAEGSEE